MTFEEVVSMRENSADISFRSKSELSFGKFGYFEYSLILTEILDDIFLSQRQKRWMRNTHGMNGLNQRDTGKFLSKSLGERIEITPKSTASQTEGRVIGVYF